jgi:hypothetical protein
MEKLRDYITYALIAILFFAVVVLFTEQGKQKEVTDRAIDLVGVGTTANDGTGDALRTAFIKVNTVMYMLDSLGIDDTNAEDFSNLRHFVDSLNQVRDAINDSIQGYLGDAELAVSMTEYDDYTGNDDFVDLLDAMGADIVALPFMRNNRLFPSDFAMVDGRAYWCVVQIKDTTEITGVKYVLATQGSYTADNFNGVALYSVSGTTYTRVAISADDGDTWKTAQYATGTKAFTSAYTAVPGIYYFAMVWNASATTTAPAIYCGDPWASANSFIFGTGTNRIAAYRESQTTLNASESGGNLTGYTNTPSIWFY